MLSINRPMNCPSPEAASDGYTSSMAPSFPALTPEIACGAAAAIMVHGLQTPRRHSGITIGDRETYQTAPAFASKVSELEMPRRGYAEIVINVSLRIARLVTGSFKATAPCFHRVYLSFYDELAMCHWIVFGSFRHRERRPPPMC